MMCWNNRSSVVSMPKIHTVSAGRSRVYTRIVHIIAGKGCAALESCWSYSDHLKLCNFLVVAHSHLSNIITCMLQ